MIIMEHRALVNVIPRLSKLLFWSFSGLIFGNFFISAVLGELYSQQIITTGGTKSQKMYANNLDFKGCSLKTSKCAEGLNKMHTHRYNYNR